MLAACLTLRVTAHDDAAATLTGVFFLPATLLVVLTGVVLGLGTRWGLVKFYWVLTKLVVALVVLGVANLAAPDVPALWFDKDPRGQPLRFDPVQGAVAV